MSIATARLRKVRERRGEKRGVSALFNTADVPQLSRHEKDVRIKSVDDNEGQWEVKKDQGVACAISLHLICTPCAFNAWGFWTVFH